MIPLMQRVAVKEKGWLTDKEMIDCIAVCNLTATDKTLAKTALRRTDIIEIFSFLTTCEEVGLAKDNQSRLCVLHH